MNFEFTEEQLAVRDAARDFAQKELLPEVIERDIHQKFPTERALSFGGDVGNPDGIDDSGLY